MGHDLHAIGAWQGTGLRPEGLPEAIVKQEWEVTVAQAFETAVLHHCTAGTPVGTQGAAVHR